LPPTKGGMRRYQPTVKSTGDDHGFILRTSNGSLFWFHGVVWNEADLAVRKANQQPITGASGDVFMGSLRNVRDNCARFVGMLVDRRAVSQHEVSWSPFDFHGTAGTHGCGAGGGRRRQHSMVRAGDDSAADAPENKKQNLEMANRDNLVKFHDVLRDLLSGYGAISQKLSHRNRSKLQCAEDPSIR